MPTQEKIDRVQELKDKLERSTITVTTDYTGITVNEMTDLRSRMRSAGVEFTVVKNTLMYLASEEAQRPNVKEIVQGPTAVALGYDDPLDVAKAVSDYIRTSPLGFGHPRGRHGRRPGDERRRRCPPRGLAPETPTGSQPVGTIAVSYPAASGCAQRSIGKSGPVDTGSDNSIGAARSRCLIRSLTKIRFANQTIIRRMS